MIRGVSCDAYAERVHAGEGIEEVADDYDVTRAEVLLACWWAGSSNDRVWRCWKAWAHEVHAAMARGEYDKVPDPPEAAG